MAVDVRGIFKAAGNFPIFQGWEVKGGIHIVKSINDRNAIPSHFRILDDKRTTLAYVEGGDLYRLINNPTTENTTDSDWMVAIQSVNNQPETPKGTWNINNLSPVLSDSSYDGQTGDYYWVTGAPNDADLTITGLFADNTVTVKDGDFIIYAVDKWVVKRNELTLSIPQELLVTQYVQDITERNSLDRYAGMRVVVQDASDDPELQQGISAEYLYQPTNVEADSEGFVRISNPSISPSGQYIVSSSNSLTITGAGTYIYTGAGVATWVLPELSAIVKGAEIKIKNRSSDQSDLNVERSGTDELFDSSVKTSRNIMAGERWVKFLAEEYWTT